MPTRAGHGFGIGPAIGRVMADLLTGRPVGNDLARFRPVRFSDGSEIVPGPYLGATPKKSGICKMNTTGSTRLKGIGEEFKS